MRSVSEKEAQLEIERAEHKRMLQEAKERDKEVLEKQKTLAKLEKKKSDLREKNYRTS